MENIVVLVDLFTFVVGTILGLVVFSRQPKNRIFQAFGLMALGTVGWNLSIFLLVARIGDVGLPARLGFSFMGLMFAGFVWFISLYPKPAKFPASWRVFAVFYALFAFIVPILPSFVKNVIIVNGSIDGDLHPILYPIWILLALLVLLFIFVTLAVRTLNTKGLEHLHNRQILLGFALFLIPMLATNGVIPLLFDDHRWNNLGPAFTIFPMAFMANAILSYRLLDIKWIVGRSLAYSLIGAIVTWIVGTLYLFLSGLVSPQYGVILAALLMAMTFQPISKWINQTVRRVMNHGSYDPEKANHEILETVRSYADMDRLLDRLTALYAGFFKAEEIAIVLFHYDSTKIIGSKSLGFPTTLTRHVSAFANAAEESRYAILEAGELQWHVTYEAGKLASKQTRWLSALQKAEVEQVIPLAVDGRLVGLLLFGKRRYDRMLSSNDLAFLNMTRFAISPALENASKYQEMKGLYAELSELDKSKSEFIHVVSHRFRTPLSAIRWNLESVTESLPKKYGTEHGAIADAHDRTIFLTTTLDRLFDTLAIESGKMTIEPTLWSARKILSPLTDQFVTKAKERGVRLTTSIPNIKVYGDQKRMLDVCEALLSNAVNYTQQGGEVDFSVKAGDRETVIEVKDTGIGIPEKDQDKIFEKFKRSKNALLSYADGQGLGLYLTREIVKLHKGTIVLSSKLGKGSTFTVTIPNKR